MNKEPCAVESSGDSAEEQVSLVDVLDRVLSKGAVVTGEIVISVAGIELLYVGLSVVIGAVETLLEAMGDGQKERAANLGTA